MKKETLILALNAIMVGSAFVSGFSTAMIYNKNHQSKTKFTTKEAKDYMEFYNGLVIMDYLIKQAKRETESEES